MPKITKIKILCPIEPDTIQIMTPNRKSKKILEKILPTLLKYYPAELIPEVLHELLPDMFPEILPKKLRGLYPDFYSHILPGVLDEYHD